MRVWLDYGTDRPESSWGEWNNGSYDNSDPNGPNGKQPSNHNTPEPPPNSGGWDYYDPWVWSSWFPMIEPSAASIPWMVATGNHDTELFSAQVASSAWTPTT